MDYYIDLKPSTTSANPGSGDFRLNNGTIGSVSEIYLNNTNYDGTNINNYILTWDDLGISNNKGYLIFKSNTNDDNTYIIFKITSSITDNTGWFTIPVSYISGTLPSAYKN